MISAQCVHIPPNLPLTVEQENKIRLIYYFLVTTFIFNIVKLFCLEEIRKLMDIALVLTATKF